MPNGKVSQVVNTVAMMDDIVTSHIDAMISGEVVPEACIALIKMQQDIMHTIADLLVQHVSATNIFETGRNFAEAYAGQFIKSQENTASDDEKG
ncbi:hypothetical protein [Bowmanella sp. JS7-9]|uniref:Uncharacterized protein n=1 Tax=Pseudobowmanella zhangzhouensis TaxID=1537679 RepID=A0ABW1XMJ6_9ALTE|nr:hypothetical protein [Bowmanella sp. JS7-9]TBX21901.1 hypothetical protein TK45_10430 [Bowmanella sp. JS7-9]